MANNKNTTIENTKGDHLWKKGESGNPAGRPKGSKNKVTIIKNALEAELVEQLSEEAAAILTQAIMLAKDGDRAMIKLLLDKLVPNRTGDERDERSGGTGKIVINVGVQDELPKIVKAEPIEGDTE